MEKRSASDLTSEDAGPEGRRQQKLWRDTRWQTCEEGLTLMVSPSSRLERRSL